VIATEAARAAVTVAVAVALLAAGRLTQPDPGKPAGHPGHPVLALSQTIRPAQDQESGRHSNQQPEAEDSGRRQPYRNYDAGHKALPAIPILRGSAFS
jgi:hypothetical protein